MSKIKMKTRKGALKRYKLTGTGKVKFKKQGLQHILSKHSSKNKRKKRSTGYVKSCDSHLVLRALPNGTY